MHADAVSLFVLSFSYSYSQSCAFSLPLSSVQSARCACQRVQSGPETTALHAAGRTFPSFRVALPPRQEEITFAKVLSTAAVQSIRVLIYCAADAPPTGPLIITRGKLYSRHCYIERHCWALINYLINYFASCAFDLLRLIDCFCYNVSVLYVIFTSLNIADFNSWES